MSQKIEEFWCKDKIWCLLEYAVTVWQPSLTNEDSLKIERVQKCALAIILGQNYKSYKSALLQLNLETLAARRIKLCEKFSIKAQKHPKFSKWFKPNTRSSVTRSRKNKFCEVYYRTERFKRSPISYLTSILNSQWKAVRLCQVHYYIASANYNYTRCQDRNSAISYVLLSSV